MSIIFFHKILCWCLMVKRSAIVKGTGCLRLSHTMWIFVICRDSTGIFEPFSGRPFLHAANSQSVMTEYNRPMNILDRHRLRPELAYGTECWQKNGKRERPRRMRFSAVALLWPAIIPGAQGWPGSPTGLQ